MDIKTELLLQFENFGVLNDAVLKKCVDICNVYNVIPEELSDEWGAFSISSAIDSVPTIRALEDMERKVYIRQKKNVVKTPTSVKVARNDVQEMETEDTLLHSYGTPKNNQKFLGRVQKTIEENLDKSLGGSNLTNSPSNFSQSNYTERTNSGKEVVTYGKQVQQTLFKRDELEKLTTVQIYPESDHLTGESLYMYEVMNVKAASLNSACEWIGQYLIKKHNLEEPQPFNKSSGNITTYGRICCDSDGKLNKASILLESSQELCKGATIKLDLNKTPEYALFPGQIVAVQGFNPNGNAIMVQKIYTDASTKIPTLYEHPVVFKEPLQIVIAAGPFTLRNNLDYQPLIDLIKNIVANPPHVLILVGPFIDFSHETIQDGLVSESFDVFFETLLQVIMKPLEGLNIQVVLVASNKDAHHHVVYPTPPYVSKKQYPNLHFTADPSLLNIEGLLIGATSIDVMLHLGKEEVYKGAVQGCDRMTRLASHLLGQQSFYPLYPSDEDVSVDHQLLDQYGMMDVMPHILIVPSNLKCFIKKINGCLVINPERLVKGYIGGTFSRIQVSLPRREELLTDCVTAKIINI